MEWPVNEYKVTRDMSPKGDNSPDELEKMMNAQAADGWRLVEAVTFHVDVTQKMYFFWERAKAST